MSKIYEALQQVKANKQELRKPPLADSSGRPPPLTHGERAALREPAFVGLERGGTTARRGFETEMLGLYRALDNLFPSLDQKVILFLGAKGGEGTSTVVCNLARVAAGRLGRKVAVLDTDTLHPAQHRLFDVVNPEIGWDDVLRETEPVEKAIYQSDEDGIWIVPVSSAKAGTIQVIDVPGMEGFFKALRERFDLVLIDCAPATAFLDSIALSRKVDGVVLVIEAESTRWPVAETLHQQISNAGGKVIGIVFNKRLYYIPECLYRRL